MDNIADADEEEEALEDDVFVLESIAEAKKNDEERLRVTMLVSLQETVASIAKILRIVEVNDFYSNNLEVNKDGMLFNLKYGK